MTPSYPMKINDLFLFNWFPNDLSLLTRFLRLMQIMTKWPLLTAFVSGHKSGVVEQVDVYGLLCRALQLSCHAYNGTMEHVEDFFDTGSSSGAPFSSHPSYLIYLFVGVASFIALAVGATRGLGWVTINGDVWEWGMRKNELHGVLQSIVA